MKGGIAFRALEGKACVGLQGLGFKVLLRTIRSMGHAWDVPQYTSSTPYYNPHIKDCEYKGEHPKAKRWSSAAPLILKSRAGGIRHAVGTWENALPPTSIPGRDAMVSRVCLRNIRGTFLGVLVITWGSIGVH